MCCVSWTRQIRKTQKSIRSWPHPSHGFLKHTDTRNDVCDEQQRCFPIAEVEWHCSSSCPDKQGAAQAIEICSSRIPSVYALPTMGRLQVLFLGKLICWRLNRFISKRNWICSLLGVFTPTKWSPAAPWLSTKEDFSFQAPAPGSTAWKSRAGQGDLTLAADSCFSPPLLEYPPRPLPFPKLLKISPENHQPSKIKDYFNPIQTYREVELCCLKVSSTDLKIQFQGRVFIIQWAEREAQDQHL